MRILSDAIHTAQKHYKCDAYRIFLDASLDRDDLDNDQWMEVEGCIADGGKILPGQKYRKVAYIDDDGFQVYRGRLDMDQLCHDLELYEEA